MKYNVWPRTKAGRVIRSGLSKPKPVKLFSKPKKYKGNVINKSAVGAGKAGMGVGKNLYKIR